MNNIARAVAIRRGLRNLDAATGGFMSGEKPSAAIELELARAYDAGHIAGSGVKNQTDAEQHLAEVARQLTAYQAHVIGETISRELAEAIDAVADEKRDTMPCPPPTNEEFDHMMSAYNLEGVSLDGDA